MNKASLGWLGAFHKQHGRHLKVLHVGNIANNAYNNAKIQRQHGIQADVLCYDYYHIMGTPEWEDSGFEGDVGDPFYPRWWRTDLKGFVRPRWFVQGPRLDCVEYLIARNTGDVRTMVKVWFRMRAAAFKHAEARALTLEDADEFIGDEAYKAEWRLAALTPEVALDLSPGMLRRLFSPPSQDGPPEQMLRNILMYLRAEYVRGNDEDFAFTRFAGLGRWQRLKGQSGGLPRPDTKPKPEHPPIAELYDMLFPDASEQQRYQDTWAAVEFGNTFRDLYQFYDVVQCYSTDGLAPLANQHKSFCSYEHGTIREIPWDDDMQGRQCRLTYSNAPYVFVTNTDNIAAIDRLQIPRNRAVWLPHAFNDKKLRNFLAANPAKPSTAIAPLIFSPARQHWKGVNGSWSKGNDVFIRGAAIAKDCGHDFRLRFVEWGHDLEISKALCDELGLSERIEWVPPMKKKELWESYIASDAIADQFFTPALGGVGFEALCLGKRLITAMNMPQVTEFFGAAPPLFACATPEDVAKAIASIAADRDDTKGIGAAASKWVEDYHSAPRVVKLQAEVYEKLVTANGPAQFQI
jgi:glycosyltransferase involved in cell wall biosynthesis